MSPATVPRHHRLDGGARPRGRRLREKRNDEGATAAVTRNSYGRGSSSRGLRGVAGNATIDPDCFGDSRRSRAGNATNPRIGSGMQQARKSPRGENRRGGAKPRGRNRNFEPGSSDPKPDGDIGWEWTRRGDVDGGAVLEDARASGRPDESHERRPVRAGPHERGALEGNQRREGTTHGLHRASRSERKTSRARLATGKVEEGTGKANDPLRTSRGDHQNLGNEALTSRP